MLYQMNEFQELELKVRNLAQESGLFQVSTLSKLQELEKDIKDINSNLLAVVKNLDSLTANFVSAVHKQASDRLDTEMKIESLESDLMIALDSGTKKDKWFNWF